MNTSSSTHQSDDPIFAAIAEHRAAYEAWRATDEGIDGEEANMKALAREAETFERVFAVMPTTSAGVAALLRWLATPQYDGGEPILAVIGEYDKSLGEEAARQLQAAAVLLEAL